MGREPDHRRRLAVEPSHPDSLHLLGALTLQAGRHAEAVRIIGRAVTVDGRPAAYRSNLALALINGGRAQEAEASLRAALVLTPDYTAALFNLGNVLKALRRDEAAIQAYIQVLRMTPEFAEAFTNLGSALMDWRFPEKAGEAFRHAICRQPGRGEAYSNLGTALAEAGRYVDAQAACRMALRTDPDHLEARYNLGNALLARGRYAASAACFRAALSLAPDHAGAWVNLANALHGLTDSAAAEESLQRVLAMAPSHPQAAKNMLVFGLYRDDLDKCDLAERHRTFGRAFGRCAEVRSFAARPSGERIRLGYLSSDLCDHPVGRAMRHPVRLHDRRRFSLHFFAQQRLHDGITGDFRAAADQWRDIGGLSDDEVARQIRADGIDILVCLAGHFDRNRPLVPAWRAAPVQISLHDVVTSGLREMDYIIGDRWLLPVRGDEYFSETGLRLPQFFLGEIPDDLPRIVNDANRPPMFGCFNNPSKINATALALWGRILNACPDSGLVLKYLDHYDCPATRERILGGLVAAGAQSSQVVFPAGGREPSARLLARYNGIDVALDPMPFSGSTTSFQALSMGVPVVTWPWDRMVSRWTAAMLSGLGLGDIIADGGDSYVATAVRLAKEPVLTRQKLRDRLRRSRLCDAEAWTRHLERLYLTAWRRHSTSLTADNAHGEEDEFGEV